MPDTARVISIKSTIPIKDERQMLKLIYSVTSQSLWKTKYLLEGTNLSSVLYFPGVGIATYKKTSFPVYYVGWGSLKFCRNSPEAGGLVPESDLTSHLFSFPDKTSLQAIYPALLSHFLALGMGKPYCTVMEVRRHEEDWFIPEQCETWGLT